MSLLEKVQKLSTECHTELFKFYEENNSSQTKFPIELRNLLAQPIENAVCGSGGEEGLDPDNSNHSGQICEFLDLLVQNLETRLNSSTEELPFFIRHKLAEALSSLKEGQRIEPLSVFRRIRECIGFELELVKRQEDLSMGFAAQEPDFIMDNLLFVRKRVEQTNGLLKRIDAEQDAFEINLAQKNELKEQLLSARDDNEKVQLTGFITQRSQAVDNNLQQMMILKKEFLEGTKANISYMSNIQRSIFQEKLFIWKYQQQQEANGMSIDIPITLERLQLYCEQLADLIWKTQIQLQHGEQLQNRNAVFATIDPNESTPSMLKEEVLRLLTMLVNEAFVVEDQPPQVLKKTTKFPAAVKVALLLGNLNIQMSAPQVSACIIREVQARTLSIADKIEKGGEIVNAQAKLEFDSKARRLIAKFPNIQLKDIKRADRRGSNNSFECVMEEKFCLLFESEVNIGDMKLRVRTMSLPVVVTSHGSQESTATAAIMWDNAFGQMGRIPFEVPSKVTWSDLSQVISARFKIVTGRGLSSDQLQYLKQKAFRTVNHSENISWSEFCKDNLPDRQFSFWEWVFAAMKTIEKKDTHLKEIWKEGLLTGFIDRLAAENMLMSQEPGTFLLRFSDSLPGAVTIVMVNDAQVVMSVNPFTIKDLETHRLADNIKKLAKLKYVFPRTPKDEAFGKYYSAEAPIARHYIDIQNDIPTGFNSMLHPSAPMTHNLHSTSVQNPFDHSISTMTSMDLDLAQDFIIRELSNPNSPVNLGGASPNSNYTPDFSQLTPSPYNNTTSSPISGYDAFGSPNNVQMVDQTITSDEFMNEHTDLLTIGEPIMSSSDNIGHWTNPVTI